MQQYLTYLCIDINETGPSLVVFLRVDQLYVLRFLFCRVYIPYKVVNNKHVFLTLIFVCFCMILFMCFNYIISILRQMLWFVCGPHVCFVWFMCSNYLISVLCQMLWFVCQQKIKNLFYSTALYRGRNVLCFMLNVSTILSAFSGKPDTKGGNMFPLLMSFGTTWYRGRNMFSFCGQCISFLSNSICLHLFCCMWLNEAICKWPGTIHPEAVFHIVNWFNWFNKLCFN